ncbi:MAG: hypothetical protein JO266_11410 [Acidobacteria bacterium]|nr:hypothetical protein [Acidobacteriota bacterium]
MPTGQSKVLLVAIVVLFAPWVLAGQVSDTSLELSRPIRSWEFLPTVGTRAALFGDESGRFEAWVYPLKILGDFHLIFHADGRALPAESLARTLTVRPEASIITYASDTFRVQETLSVPLHEAGAIIELEVTTAEPIEIEATFKRDFQLEWPASLGGTYSQWNSTLAAFSLGEEQKRFAALVGSPRARLSDREYATNYSASSVSSFLLEPIPRGTANRTIIIAASVEGPSDAETTYQRLTRLHDELLRDSSDYYQEYLASTVTLHLPNRQLEQAYDWARISMAQGKVVNPYLGAGLVAGYRTSGGGQRPGFAWFFGRDALWTDLALDAQGDFARVRESLEFLAKYQRSDGKIPHEISQSASLLPWFTAYPYAYASVDATPLYVIAANDYVSHSGDLNWAREHWETLTTAHKFLRSTYDRRGLPQNLGFGHGWVEGGPLLPVGTELYQSGLGAEALHALASLATGLQRQNGFEQDFEQSKVEINQAFWSADKKLFSFALDSSGRRIEIASVLSTVPMWFGLLDAAKAESTLNFLADWDQETDWGMRIISSQDPRYDPGGYHFGAVWPLFTGWAAVAEYHYHRALPAYFNLYANAQLTLTGSLGHVTEVLSGDYFEPLSTSSPHQIWSAAMVVSPLLIGMLGLTSDALSHTITLAPHLPYNWSDFGVDNMIAGSCKIRLQYRRRGGAILVDIKRSGSGPCTLRFSPAVSLHARVAAAEINGRRLTLHVEKSSFDQHATVVIPLSPGFSSLRIFVRNDFGLFFDPELPSLGSRSQGLRVVSECWTPDGCALELILSGRKGHTYEFGLWNAEQILRIDGATIEGGGNRARMRVVFSGTGSQEYVHAKISMQLRKKN